MGRLFGGSVHRNSYNKSKDTPEILLLKVSKKSIMSASGIQLYFRKIWKQTYTQKNNVTSKDSLAHRSESKDTYRFPKRLQNRPRKSFTIKVLTLT